MNGLDTHTVFKCAKDPAYLIDQYCFIEDKVQRRWVLDCESWEEVGVVYGHFEPDVFAGYLVQAAQFYNGARILVERNNHGHAVLLALDYAGMGRSMFRRWTGSPGGFRTGGRRCWRCTTR